MVARCLGLSAGLLAFGLSLFAGAQPVRADGEVASGASAQCEKPDDEGFFEKRAQRPVGSRQRKIFGKLWPPFPRPTGPAQTYVHKYHSALYWPFPYRCEDQLYVRQVSEQQVNSGWTTATTLYEYHFDGDGQTLNHAGRLQLRWILESVPVQRRMIHVQYGITPDVTELRVANARQEAALIAGEANVPPILVRIVSPFGRPAQEIDAIRRLEREAMPAPKINYSTGASSSGGGGGGGGGM